MNEIVKKFLRLNPVERKEILILLCEQALKVWKDFTLNKETISYKESVCGTLQIVDMELPSDALKAVKSESDLLHVYNRYLEPISAMQDEDLEFPENVEYAFYSIYNLYKKYICNDKTDDWLIANQALASVNNIDQSVVFFNELLNRFNK